MDQYMETDGLSYSAFCEKCSVTYWPSTAPDIYRWYHIVVLFFQKPLANYFPSNREYSSLSLSLSGRAVWLAASRSQLKWDGGGFTKNTRLYQLFDLLGSLQWTDKLNDHFVYLVMNGTMVRVSLDSMPQQNVIGGENETHNLLWPYSQNVFICEASD